MNLTCERHGRYRHEGPIDPAAMDAAILDAMAAHLPKARAGMVTLTLEVDEWEICISTEHDDMPRGLEEAVRAIAEIALPFPETQGAEICYQADLGGASASQRAAFLQALPEAAAKAARRTCDLLTRHGRKKDVKTYLRGLERPHDDGDDE